MSYIHINHHDPKFIKIPENVLFDGKVLTIPKDQHLTETLTIKITNRSILALKVIVEQSSSVKIILDIEDHINDGSTYDLFLETKANTQVKFLFIADISGEKTILNFNSSSLADSNLEFIAGFVSNILDTKLFLDLNGKGANLKVRTITVSAKDNQQSLDVHMTHHAPNTTAEMTNIGIAGENGIVKINGVGQIEAGMKNSSAYQTLKGIITSDDAQIDVNPILIIDEFDVKAGHAATVGKLEEDVLYYLRSRGLTLQEAQKLIINGFLQPIIDEIDDEAIKENVINLVNERI